MAPKRCAASEPETEERSKRYKVMEQCFDDTAEELVCPITTELPVDPVTAEDGRVYERRAIEDWIARPGELKSPTANTPMGPRLLPARQSRNIIERMVRAGAISGPKAEAWSKKLAEEEEEKARKLAEEEEVRAMRARAEGGDGEAMTKMGHWHYHGQKGLAVDYPLALGWYHRGHLIGHATCTAHLGYQYERGQGVVPNLLYAMHLYTAAAKGGSETGCIFLADFFIRLQEYGVPQMDKRSADREATQWHLAAQSAPLRDAHW